MKKALIAGINNYPFAPLHGCVRDATDLAALIAVNGDQSPNFTVKLQTNITRRHTLRELLTELFSGRNETALFYFSGHGFINERGAYLLTPDHREYDEGVSMGEILNMANNSLTSNKIIILDCCHSGAITAPALTHSHSGHINEGITILTASRQNEVAMEVNGRGVFTSLLLEALKGGAANLNGHITPGSIYAYIDQALGPWEQRPVFKTNVSRFTPVRTVSPQLSYDVLRKITTYFSGPAALHELRPSYEYTNSPTATHVCIAPYADAADTAVFSDLQQMNRAGLVEPVGETHMYWAAMHNKACRLTLLGHHYWRLVKEQKI